MRSFPFVFGLAALIFGLVMFVRLGDEERQLSVKLQTIHDGLVQPESLTVLRKYISTSRRNGNHPHVILHGSRDAKVNIETMRTFYDSVDKNSTVTGYYFPDGYFIPQEVKGDPGTAKWIFLSFAGLIGTGLIILGFVLVKSKSSAGNTRPQEPGLKDLLAALQNRGKKE